MRALLCCEVVACLMATANAAAQSESSFSKTGFDMTTSLLDKGGFLPVPIVLSEPSVGYGGGLALVSFKRPIESATNQSTFIPRPAITGGAGVHTETGAFGAGLSAYKSFYKDRLRYLGLAGLTSIPLRYYGFDQSAPIANNPLDYSFRALGTLQRMQFRVKKSRLYGGVHYAYIDTRSDFDSDVHPSSVPARDIRKVLAGAGSTFEYDTRDSYIDAWHGMDLVGDITWYANALGGTSNFGKMKLAGLFYSQPSTRWGFAGRFDVRSTWGEVPFFEKPYLSMRGFTAQQFSNGVAELQEVEARYGFAPRWTFIGFGGTGRTAPNWSEVMSASTQVAGGVGFRYMLAERLRLNSGFDLAVGPGGNVTLYVQNGGAWR
jgi:hypothetical protein